MSQTFTFNIKAIADMKDVQTSIQNIQNALKQLKLPNDLQSSFKKTFGDLERELDKYQKLKAGGVKTKGDASALEKSGNNIIRLYDDIVKKINSLDNSALKKAFEDIGAKEVENLKQQLDDLQTSLKTSIGNNIGSSFQNLKKSFKDLSAGAQDLDKELSKIGSSTLNTFINNLSSGRLDLAEKNFESLGKRITEVTTAINDQGGDTSGIVNWLSQITEAFEKVKEDDSISSITQQMDQLKQSLATAKADALQGLIDGFKTGATNADDFLQKIRELISADKDWANEQANVNKELDQIKSRIQYFFGLNNAINLVKRAIRSAFNTIKELDKVMTETAVVTDYTVSDMWKRLPEYTQRANQLGVSTKAAYEAATLYYQQGLNTQQAGELSVETLKMARIAGLEAAEATDRMTNALRGFNMELDAVSAQRVDDVYSQLAAHTASNVDEISTAMTKVASLAHSANMEFETTAAFLSQIIETTRESAETAGTALKTVVARFSEVKKLFTEQQISGQDEEGEIINVNKVAAALRTAGIDLNKYFLGEVGLDDIFIELASKWDSLTSIQQRYIATQAAGSRQQSRFIALMQDYARTQELVGLAYNATGASAKQFEKTQESLESKLARLKNAWNEFLMGLANSNVVKFAVDALTTLLNIVNNLTSAFGDGVGSILKWAAALSAIPGGKALLGGTLMNFLASAGIGNGEKGSLIGKLGKGVWQGFQNLGGTTGLTSGAGLAATTGLENFGTAMGLTQASASGTAAGIMGIATALGAVAAAAAVATTAYAIWLRTSSAGKYKQATNYANAMAKAADSTQKTLNNLRTVQERYSELTGNVKGSIGTKDYESSIQARNDYLASLLKEDATFVKYIQSSKDLNGNLVLTLDEDALASACDSIAKAAVLTAAEASMASGAMSLAQAGLYQEQARRNSLLYGTSSSERLAEIYNLETEAQAKKLEGLSEITTGVKSKLLASYTTLNDDLAENLANIFADNFDFEAYTKALNFTGILRGESYWRDQYSKTFGVEASGEMSATAMRRAVVSTEALDEQYNNINLNKINAALKGTQGAQYQALLDAYSGKGKILDIDLSDINISEISDSEIADLLGFKSIENNLDDFAQAINTNKDALLKNVKAQINATKYITAQSKSNIFSTLAQAGISLQSNLGEVIQNLSANEAASLETLIVDARTLLGDEGLKLFTPEIVESIGTPLEAEISKLFESIDLSDAAGALLTINEQEKSAPAELQKYITQIKKANSNLFTNNGLVQSFMLSDSYDNITESLGKFIEDNGRISSDNIVELAKDCKALQNLLDATDESAQALANTFTLFEQGKIGIDQVTDALLEALGAGASFEEIISDVYDWIEKFDKGKDLKEGTEHITEQLDELSKYVDNWEFGNEPTKNIYNHLFPEGEYDKLLNEFGNNFDGLEKEIESRISRLKEYAANEGRGGIEAAIGQVAGISEIAGTNGKFFEWDLSSFQNTTQAIESVASALGVSQGAAEAFILSWQTHMPKLREEWDTLDFQTKIETFATSVQGQVAITEQDLAALAAATGKTVDEVETELLKLQKEHPELEIPIIAKWTKEDGSGPLTGDDLIKSFKEKFGNGQTIKVPVYIDGGYNETEIDNAYKDFQQYIITDADKFKTTINADGLFSDLASRGLSQSQANEIAANFQKQLGGALLSKTISIPEIEIDDSGNSIVKTVEKTVEAADLSSLEAKVNAELEAANVKLLAQALANEKYEGLTSSIQEAVYSGIETGSREAWSSFQEAAAQGISVPVTLTGTGILGALFGGPSGAKGGYVRSLATGYGSQFLQSGFALTGEEGPEIVWNKERGYAYVTGKNGPEFQNLQPGDRVFNAAETARIFRNSIGNQYQKSFAGGGWKEGQGGGSGSDKAKEDKWKNEIDWLYNLVEDIAELERIQTQLEEKYEDYLDDEAKTGKDLYELLVQQLGNLQTQLNHQTLALEKREQEMREFMDTTNKYDDYLWYNWEDRTIEIDWDRIEALQDTDKETYEEIKDLISQAEDIQGKMDDAEDAIQDIQNQIQELENIWRDTYSSFEKRIYQAIVQQYQRVIDEFSDLNTTLNDSNSAILESLQRQIDLERQQRSNEKTQQGISDREAQLAYLRRDTTGGNALAALELEKQLAEDRESYEDTLVDQAIARLQQDNSEAADQRARQIEIMQAQLDYQSESGEFNAEVLRLITDATSGEGALLTGSDLVKLLQSADNWSGMSEVNREIWEEELNNTFKQAVAFLLKDQAENTVIAIDENGNEITQFIDDVNKYVQAIAAKIGAISQAKEKNSSDSSSKSGGGSGGGSGSSGGGTGGSGKTQRFYKIASGNIILADGFSSREAADTRLAGLKAQAEGTKDKLYQELQKNPGTYTAARYAEALEEYKKVLKASVVGYNVTTKYKTGGLVNSTGPAWLDGTKSRPEYVLNARQTDAFLHLVDVLPSIMGKISNTSIQSPTNIELNIEMKVDKISSDYDVDKIADRVKNIIYNIGSYRNVNTLSLKR